MIIQIGWISRVVLSKKEIKLKIKMKKIGGCLMRKRGGGWGEGGQTHAKKKVVKAFWHKIDTKRLFEDRITCILGYI